MTDDQKPVPVSDYKGLSEFLKRVENTVYWKSAGLPAFDDAMEHHKSHSTPDTDLDAGLAYMVNPEVLSVRVSIVVSTDDIYVRADTATEYHWKQPLEIDRGTVLDFLQKEGVRRSLATTAAHLVDAGSTVGYNLENPALRLEGRMRNMVGQSASADRDDVQNEDKD